MVGVPRSWRDHHFQGQPVMPAVEAMQLLADRIQTTGAADPLEMTGVRFPKFLPIDPEGDGVEMRCRTRVVAAGGRQASLSSTMRVGSARMRRSVTHAELFFGAAGPPVPPFPLDLAATVEGICDTIAPEVIYRELVPFGPDYRSIDAPLVLSADGALARVRAPSRAGALAGPLGSGFPLDGAFHAACVWGQRFAGRVAFPVAIGRRSVLVPTTTDDVYTARVVPVAVTATAITVEILILDAGGCIREVVLGVEMRDVSRGAWQPPTWMAENTPRQPHFPWTSACLGSVLIERAHMAGFAARALDPMESRRLAGMGQKRRQGFIAGRLALKRLWRQMAVNDRETSATTIGTVVGGDPRPVLPAIDGGPPRHCSLAHDARFCVAVAHGAPVGVDVEPITGRALRVRHLFMQASERALPKATGMDEAMAALRLWSIKEAAAKAWDLDLAEAWAQITGVSVGETESRFKDHRGRIMTAQHATVAGHLVTVVAEPVQAGG